MTLRTLVVAAALVAAAMPGSVSARTKTIVVAQSGAHSEPADPDVGKIAGKTLTPEQVMAARYPHPAKVGFLIGLPILDWNDNTLGYVRHVARTPDGKIRLIVSYGGWAGGYLNWGARPVAVPIEVVQLIGRQIGASDMTPAEFDKAPTWTEGQDTLLSADQTIRIALGRR